MNQKDGNRCNAATQIPGKNGYCVCHLGYAHKGPHHSASYGDFEDDEVTHIVIQDGLGGYKYFPVDVLNAMSAQELQNQALKVRNQQLKDAQKQIDDLKAQLAASSK